MKSLFDACSSLGNTAGDTAWSRRPLTILFHVIQALPLVTVIVGSQISGNTASVVTVSEILEESKRIDFDLPTPTEPLQPGKPSWANYIKGVIQHYRGKSTAFKSINLNCKQNYFI